MDYQNAAYQSRREGEKLFGYAFRHPAPVLAEGELVAERPLPTSWMSPGCLSARLSILQEVDQSTISLLSPTPGQDKHLRRHREPKLPICDCTIDEMFRDLKSLLGMTRLMNKQQQIMEKMLALLLLVFAIGLLIGEAIRDHLYGERMAVDEIVSQQERIPGSPHLKKGKKWKRYSGLFVLLKQKWSIPAQELRKLQQTALTIFMAMVSYPVPTYV
jgi:hypothetical protein